MPLYRYYVFDIDGEVCDIRAVEERDDSLAIHRAHNYLADQVGRIAIEIWRGQGFVSGVKRDGSLYARQLVPMRPSDLR